MARKVAKTQKFDRMLCDLASLRATQIPGHPWLKENAFAKHANSAGRRVNQYSPATIADLAMKAGVLAGRLLSRRAFLI